MYIYHIKLDSFPMLKDFSEEVGDIKECELGILYNEMYISIGRYAKLSEPILFK